MDLDRLTARAAARDDRPCPQYGSVATWCELTGISRSKTYELLASGDLIARRLGGRTLVDIQAGLAWIATLPKVET